ncbi:MAG TPA: BcsR/BcsP family cellulose biosynthesis protein [Gallionella sp.]|nr:BcsR/BcsP family cellulose biosynthesis protein [Gallionella sp.]
MKKSANVDIRNLFHKFGGEPETYQEIKREHAEGQAQQSWPIVAAMRNELQSAPKGRVAAPAAVPPAPVLHAHAAPAAGHSPVSGHGLFAARPKADAGTGRAAPTVVAQHAPAPGASGLARSLFGGSAAAPAAVAQATTPQAHAGQMPGVGQSAQAVSSRGSDQLDAVFSRLLNPHQSDTAHAPQNDLRSMLGFLKK